MKRKILTACLVLLLAVPAFALRGDRTEYSHNHGAVIDFTTWIDANKILMFVTNKGSFAYDNGVYLGKADGLYFPYTGLADILSGSNTLSVIYAGSIWAGATVAATYTGAIADVGDTIVTSGQHDTDWGPGPLIDGHNPPDAISNGSYRVYKLYADSLGGHDDPTKDNPNRDWLEWPVQDGAPVDSNGNPLMIGDQMCWSVYNDLDVDRHVGARGTVGIGLGLEVRQTAWAYAREGALANIVFMKFQFFNEGPYDLDNLYVSLWSDPDLGDAGDDLVGSDSARSLGYCYNDGTDANYGSRPPAVGYDFFQGPLVFTGNDADTAKMWSQHWPGYQNMPMSSFMIYINPYGPDVPRESYYFMNGLQKDGSPVINTETGLETKFFGTGDPVTGTGFLDNNSSDRRFMMSVGPITFPQGDSTEIVAAILVGQGSNQLRSITELRAIDDYAQKVFDKDFALPKPPAPPNVTVRNLANEVVLTWDQTSETDHGDYPFEGYALFQGSSSNGPWTDTLMWSDVRNGMAGIIDYATSEAAGGIDLPYVAKPGKDEGLQRYFSTTKDVTGGGQLINYTEYYYRVEAYSVDTLQPSGEKTLTSAKVVTAMPQPQLTGTDILAKSGEEIAAPYTGPKPEAPGSAEVYVVDPAAVTGHDYEITFSTDDDLGNVWHVIDVSVTPEDTVVKNWVNQSDVSGAEDYPIVDGLLIKVAGPAPSFELFQVTANGGGALDPPVAGAFDFDDFPTGTDASGTPLRPGDDQQLGAGKWGIHTADNGGTSGGGTRCCYDSFISRVTRDGSNFPVIGAYDYEMRFTGDNTNPGVGGSYGIEGFTDDNVYWVPFELWNIGVGTPDDPSDDVRLIPLMIDDGNDDTFNLESWGTEANGGGDLEHSCSGGDDDPFTDWVYWYTPTDMSPGEAGYLAQEAEFLAGPPQNYTYVDEEVFARMVLVNWNGGTEPPFNQALPEQGTVFRISTAKPNAPGDVYSFSTAGYQPSVKTAGPEALLDNIKAVPNPYYLFSAYDDGLYNRHMKFINLPAECTIEIYNLGGDLVRKVLKEDPTATELMWDLLNTNGVPVGSGIYIYVVDAPAFGQKIGKMAIFTEVELLDQY